VPAGGGEAAPSSPMEVSGNGFGGFGLGGVAARGGEPVPAGGGDEAAATGDGEPVSSSPMVRGAGFGFGFGGDFGPLGPRASAGGDGGTALVSAASASVSPFFCAGERLALSSKKRLARSSASVLAFSAADCFAASLSAAAFSAAACAATAFSAAAR